MQDKFRELLLFAYVLCMFVFSYVEGYSFITKIVVALLIVLFIAGGFSNKKIIIPREFILVVAWLTWGLISSVFSENSENALFRIITILQILFSSLIVCNFVVWSKYQYSIGWYIIIAALAVSLLTFSNPAAFSSDEGRWHGTFNNSNLMGLVAIVSIVFSTFYILEKNPKSIKLILLILVGVFFYVVLMTGSRKALLCSVLLPLIIARSTVREIYKRNKARAIGALILFATIIGIASFAIYQSEHFRRIERIYVAISEGDKSKAGGSELGRAMLYEKGIEVVLNNPILGIGIDGFRDVELVAGQGSVGTYSHSNYIEVMTSTGLIGLLLYYSFYISLMIKLGKLRKINPTVTLRLATILLLLIAIYDFAMVSYYEKVSWLFTSVIIALSVKNEKDLIVSRKMSSTNVKGQFNVR